MTEQRSVIDEIPVSLTILVAFLALALACGVISPDGQRLLLFGSMHPGRIAHGEPWRLVSYAFLHGGLLHLVMNTAMFTMLAPMLERELGSLKFTVLFAVTAIAGAIGSIVWEGSPLHSVVGASGALFGMVGAQVAVQIRAGRHAMEFLGSVAGRRAIVFILILLAFGFLMPGISNSAHIGGLIAGFVLTLTLLVPPRLERDGIAKAAVAGWVALFLSLTAWSLFPATRWDSLYGRLQGNADDRPLLEGIAAPLARHPVDDLSTDRLRRAVIERFDPEWAEITSPVEPGEN